MRDVVVVGAGLAGLAVARALQRDGVVVLEASRRAGGRVRTQYEDRKGEGARVAYESGPWRVPETHTRVRRLFAEMDVALVPRPSPPETQGMIVPGLSTWDAHALRSGDPRVADDLDLATGYADETHAASAPYTTDADRYYVAPEGFSLLIERLAQGVQDVRYDHRVVDARVKGRRYELTVRRRVGHNRFRTETMECDALVVCVPPHACREWTIFREHARSVMSAVVPGALHHIYVRDAAHPRGKHVKAADSLAAQFISSQYEDSPWFQASYTGGRLATLWHHLRLSAPDAFWTVLRTQVRKMVGGWTPAEDAAHASHYWPHAYHAWRPVPHFDLARAVRTAVRPNPHALPRVFLAGEAFSSHQAWMEGALETAELAVGALLARAPPRPHLAPTEHVTVEGWTLDVAEWMRVHPGGEAALRNHLGEDVTALMHHVGHSEHAWAVVHSLKRA